MTAVSESNIHKPENPIAAVSRERTSYLYESPSRLPDDKASG